MSIDITIITVRAEVQLHPKPHHKTMVPPPSMLRALELAGRQGQIPILRTTFQRRFASTGPSKLVGPMDNAFNRERLAVKHHAAQSAGEYPLRPQADRRSYTYSITCRSLAEALYLVLHPEDISWKKDGSHKAVLSYRP